MSEQQRSWEEVSQQFNELGRKVRERYEASAKAAGADSEEVRDSLRTLTDTLDRAFTAVGDAVRDPAFRGDIGRTANSLGTALGDALRELGDDISRRFPRSGR